MAYAFLVSAGASSSDGASVTTGAIDTTGANYLGAVVSDYALVDETTPPSVLSDSKGNSWSARTAYTDGDGVRVREYYCQGATVGSGHTFTATRPGAVNTYPTVTVAAFSGAAASPYDTENGTGNTSTATLAPGSITPSQNSCVVVAGAAAGGVSQSFSIDSSFTIPTGCAQDGSATAVGGALAYKIQTGAAAVNPTWTVASAREMAVAQASFKAAVVAVALEESYSLPPRQQQDTSPVQVWL